jgi:rod shape-determining protein MreB
MFYREIAKALDKSIQRIEDAVMETLSQTPPELAADIYNTGIYLAGGGSMLRGLDKRISQKTDLPVYIARSVKSSCSWYRNGIKNIQNLKVS